MRVDIDDARVDDSTWQLLYQLRRAVGPYRHEFGIKPFLEAAGSISAQAERDRGAAHVAGLEVRSLQQDARSAVVDLADRAAHHTGNRRWPLRVGDEQHVGCQVTLHVVQRG